MSISTFLDLKRAAAVSILARLAGTGGTSGSRLIWPLALACGFLIFVIGSSVYLVRSSQADAALVNLGLRVEIKIWFMINIVRIAESGQRGYLLTGDRAYLDTYRIATNEIGPAIADLNATIINPTQHRAVAQIEPLIGRKFAVLAETVRLQDAGQREEALALVRKGTGLHLMAEIHARSLQILETEKHILDLRSSNSSSTIEWLLAVNLLGLAIITALSAVSILVMRRLARKERAYVGELERSNQELDDFAYIASHDLKEPLRGLFNHASFLLEDYRDKNEEDGVRRLNRLGQLCQRMELLINDLMYFSRLGRVDLAMQETDPNAVVAEIAQMMETLLTEKHARIIVPQVMPKIVCDKTRVTEVLRNLITNAVKYNDKPERLVEIGFLESTNDHGRAEKKVFFVRDNGVGIDPEFHQAIFRIFKRLQNSSDKSDNGTGVGLTFVKKIVERHGGRVWLESERGKGTTFYFSLMCGPKHTARIAHEPAIDSVPIHSAG